MLVGLMALSHGMILAETALLHPDMFANIKSAFSTLFDIVIMLVMIAIVRKLTGFNYFAVVASLSLILFTASGNASAPLTVLVFLFSAIIVGQNLLRVVNTNDIDAEIPMMAFLVGAGIYGTIIGLIAHFPVNTPLLYMALLALPPVIFRADAKQLVDLLRQKLTSFDHESGIATPLIAALSLFYLTIPIYPEVGHDALAVHLFVPIHVLENLSWGYNPEFYSWAVMPLFADWIYTICFAFGGETAARLINLVFLGSVALCMRAVARDCSNNTNVANSAVALFLLTPLTMIESASLFVENIWAAYMVASAILVVRFLIGRLALSQALILGGCLLGIAAATKAITLPIFAVFGAFALLRLDRIYKEWSNKAFLLGLSFLLAFGLIPYVTAWIISGNPVFPFFNSIFQSPFFPPVDFTNPLFSSGFTWTLPYDVLFDTNSYLEASSGASGFQYLLLLPAALVVITYNRNWAALAYVGIAIALIFVVFQSQSYLRYIYPASALLTALSVIALMPNAGTGKLNAHFYKTIIAITLASNAIFMVLTAFPYRDFPVTAFFSQQHRADYIQHRVPIRHAVNIVNSVNMTQSPVAVLGNSMVAGLTADALHANWYNSKFAIAARELESASSFSDLLKQYSAEFIIMDDSWWDEKRQKVVKEASNPIGKIGTLHVRQLRLSYDTEVVINPDYSTLDGWIVSDGASYDEEEKAVSVNHHNSVYQRLEITPHQKLENTVIANCLDQPATGRLQVNWHDATDQFIKADIKLFDCNKNPTEYKMTIVAPREAEYAILYTTGHSDAFLQYRLNSLKK